ncbi:hypothetical protein MTO96_016585 [Rhipicephalus appendiculatus]
MELEALPPSSHRELSRNTEAPEGAQRPEYSYQTRQLRRYQDQRAAALQGNPTEDRRELACRKQYRGDRRPPLEKWGIYLCVLFLGWTVGALMFALLVHLVNPCRAPPPPPPPPKEKPETLYPWMYYDPPEP